jgi:hypothetical protein
LPKTNRSGAVGSHRKLRSRGSQQSPIAILLGLRCLHPNRFSKVPVFPREDLTTFQNPKCHQILRQVGSFKECTEPDRIALTQRRHKLPDRNFFRTNCPNSKKFGPIRKVNFGEDPKQGYEKKNVVSQLCQEYQLS